MEPEYQCNSCGVIESSVGACRHCVTKVCDRCRVNHENVCEQMQKKRARGQGPTVVRRVLVSAPLPPDPVDVALDGVKDLLKGD